MGRNAQRQAQSLDALRGFMCWLYIQLRCKKIYTLSILRDWSLSIDNSREGDDGG